MADAKTLDRVSVEYGGFYVPQFEIRVDNSQLPGGVLRDVVEITYKDKLEEIDSCELTVNNWSAETCTFKYMGAEWLDDEGKPTQADANSKYWTIFDPCNKAVTLSFGYAGVLETIFAGSFTTCEPSFSSSGPPVMKVRLLNRMHKLRSKKYDDSWPKGGKQTVQDSEIAEYISKKRDDKTGEARFPIPIEVDDGYRNTEPALPFVVQKSQYDVDFLWERARRNGYDLHLEGEGKDEKLIFKRSTAPDRPVYKLEWGQSLIEFKPTVTTGNQYKSVTLKGFDRATQKPIEEKIERTDPKVAEINKNLRYLVEQCDPREEQISDIPVSSKKEAQEVAASIFADQSKRMVKVSGTTVGLPLLRAGSRFELGDSLGSRLRGMYFVTSTTHTFNNSGYTTRFEARREGNA
jgi:uncharacterized protein